MSFGPVVVTGAARGIGLAIAHEFAAKGRPLGLIDVASDRLVEASEEIRGRGVIVVGACADTRDSTMLEQALASIEAELGPVQVLVNNAAIAAPPPSVAERADLELWRSVIDVNLSGTYLASRAVGRRMIERARGGAIVNIASIYGVRALDWQLYVSDPEGERFDDVAYHVSKAAVIQLTRSLATSWAALGIRVNCVSPGPVDNASSREALDPAVFDRLRRRVPLNRLATDTDIAQAVEFLASDRAQYITGVNLLVDGGWTCW